MDAAYIFKIIDSVIVVYCKMADVFTFLCKILVMSPKFVVLKLRMLRYYCNVKNTEAGKILPGTMSTSL
jgi:hypothetical protein